MNAPLKLQDLRLVGVDAGRFISIAAVVLIHTAHKSHFENVGDAAKAPAFGVDAGGILDQLSRFAVPFFFASSGYFAVRFLDQPMSKVFGWLASRLLPIYAVWTTLYVLMSADRNVWLTQPGFMLRWALNGGPGFHLWFLPSLALCLALAVWMLKRFAWTAVIAVSISIFGVGVLLSGYLQIISSDPNPLIRTLVRDSPAFGLIFVVAGMWFALHPPPNLRTAIIIFLGGAALQLAEAGLLDAERSSAFYDHNFLLGTLPFGIGAFLIALNIRRAATPVQCMAQLGRYSLGIYVMHLAFVWLAASIIHPANLAERLSTAMLALLAACATTFTLSQWRWSRPLVA